MEYESPVPFKPALSRKDALRTPSPLFAHLLKEGRIDFHSPVPGCRPEAIYSPSAVQITRPDRIDYISPTGEIDSPSPPYHIDSPGPVLGPIPDPVAGFAVPVATAAAAAAAPPIPAGLRLPVPPPGQSADEDKYIVDNRNTKLAQEETLACLCLLRLFCSIPA
jgi:hypothetical protein